MLESQITRSVHQLKQALGKSELFLLGRRSGFEKRARSITTLTFREQPAAVPGDTANRVDRGSAAGLQRGWLACAAGLEVGRSQARLDTLITNLDRNAFDVVEILRAYRLRWQIELYYKELKSYANLHAFCTSKPHIAEGLIWAALCAAFLKRYFAHACQRTSRDAISTRRVAMCSHSFLTDFFQCLRRGFRGLRPLLERTFHFLRVNAPRSNLNRERRRGRLAFGLDLAGPAPGRALP